jgi:hypothetical protein
MLYSVDSDNARLVGLSGVRLPRIAAACLKYFEDPACVFAVVTEGQVVYQPRDLILGAAPSTNAGQKKPGFSQLGVGFVADASNSGLAFNKPAGLATTMADVSVLLVMIPSNAVTGTNKIAFSLDNSTNGTGDPDIGLWYSETNQAFIYVDNTVDAAANNTSLLNTVQAVVLTKAGTAKKAWANGVQVINTTNGAASHSTTSDKIGIGRGGSSAGSYASGTYLAAAMWNRTLTDAEAYELSKLALVGNPAGRRFRPRYVVPASGGGGVNVTPGVGVLTVTGFAPTVSTPVNCTPGVGSLTLTGDAPTVATPVNTTPGVGTLTLTGPAPAVATPIDATPGLGQLTLTGFVPTVATPVNVAPGAGALTLTGLAPAVQAGAGAVPGTGVLSLTGFVPAVSTPVSVLPGVGVVTLAGLAPAVVVNTIAAPGVGPLTLTGFAPTIVLGTVVAPAAGQIALAGEAPTVTVPIVVTPGVGALTLTGFIPTVYAGQAILPAKSPTQLGWVTLATTLAAVDQATLLTFIDANGDTIMGALYVKTGESGARQFKLTGADGNAENLTGATGTVTVRKHGVAIIDKRAMTVVDAANGVASFTQNTTDFAAPGTYDFEVSIVRADGTIGQFPEQGYAAIAVTQSLTQ